MTEYLETPDVPEDVADKEAFIKGFQASLTKLHLRFVLIGFEDILGGVPKQIYDQNDSEKVHCKKLGWNAAIREWFDGQGYSPHAPYAFYK